MDKVGHMYSSYHLEDLEQYGWSRNDKKRIDLRTSLGFAFLTAVEVLDGFFFRMGCFLEYNCRSFRDGFIRLQELYGTGSAVHQILFIFTQYAQYRPNV
jgi:hypothetical protein